MLGGGREEKTKMGRFQSMKNLFYIYIYNCLYSCTRGPSLLANERVPAIHVFLNGGHLVLRCDHDGVLVHQLAAGVGESGQGQVDPLHFAFVHPLLVLLLHVPAPGNDHTRVNALNEEQEDESKETELLSGDERTG